MPCHHYLPLGAPHYLLARLRANVKRKDLQKYYQIYCISLCTLKMSGFGMSKIHVLCKILCVILLFCMVGATYLTFLQNAPMIIPTHLFSCGCDKLDPYATTLILMQRPYATSLFFKSVSKRWCVCVSGLVCVYLGMYLGWCVCI